MRERLLAAKNLLSDKGSIFISIDDNEEAVLKLLEENIPHRTNVYTHNRKKHFEASS